MSKNFDDKQLALIAIVVAVIIGGGIAPMAKVAVTEIPPLSFSFFRFVLAGICIVPFFLRSKPKLTKESYKVVLFSLLMSFNVILSAIGVHLTTATIAQTLYVFVPIIVAILSFFYLSERFTRGKTVGLLLGFLGAMIIILLPVLANNAPFSGNILGNTITFLGVITTAIYTMLSKPFQQKYSPQQLTSIFIFTTAIVSLPLASIDLWTSPNWWHAVSPNAIWATVYCAIFATAIWYALYQYAIKHGSPVIASLSLFLQPGAAFVWAAVLLGEQLTTGLLIGGILAFTGVYLTLNSKK